MVETLPTKSLETNLEEYVTSVGNLIGADQVGKICLCPDGIHYCNWSSAMFEEFIVDTNFWNVVSVQVFHKVINQLGAETFPLISTSSINQIIGSPGGRHSLITMSNQMVLANLQPGQEIRIVFKWLDNEVLRCIVMKNVIPTDPETPTPPAE